MCRFAKRDAEDAGAEAADAGAKEAGTRALMRLRLRVGDASATKGVAAAFE